MKGKQINSFINNSYEMFCSRNIQNCFERFLLSNYLFFNLSRFFSYLLKTFGGNFFYIFIFIYGFLILFQMLKIWSLVGLLFVVNDNKKNYISFLQ